MLSAVLGLFIIALIIHGVVHLVHIVAAHIGHGRYLDRISQSKRLKQDIQKALDASRHWHARVALGDTPTTSAPQLTREQRKAIHEADAAEREHYLDTMYLDWYQVVIVFLVGSVAGLFLEEIWMYITAGLTQSRVGLVWGPFSPLYGFGAMFLTLICYWLRKKKAKIWQVFLVAVVVGGSMEQLTGWGMETFFKASSWNYLALPDHITQWVAWRFLFFWGVLGTLWYKYVMPEVLYLIGEPDSRFKVIMVALLTIYLAADIFMTVECFICKAQRDAGIPPQNSFEVWVDKHYTNQFIAERFQNLTIGSQK